MGIAPSRGLGWWACLQCGDSASQELEHLERESLDAPGPVGAVGMEMSKQLTGTANENIYTL